MSNILKFARWVMSLLLFQLLLLDKGFCKYLVYVYIYILTKFSDSMQTYLVVHKLLLPAPLSHN